MPKLIVRRAGVPDRIIDVSDKVVTIGRSRKSIVCIDDLKASRHHCLIFEESGAFYIEDKGSSNGTYLNCAKISKVPIKSSDAVIIGKHVIFFDAIPENAKLYEDFAAVEEKDSHTVEKSLDIPAKPELSQEPPKPAQPTGPIYVLEVIEGEESGRHIYLYDVPITIGRNPQNQIVIHDPLSSNFHAEVRKEADGVFVYDLGSTNGTTVNGKKVVKAQLFVGIELKIASTRMIFKNMGTPVESDGQLVGAKTVIARVDTLKKKKNAMPLLWIASAAIAIAIAVVAYLMVPKNNDKPVVSSTPVAKANLLKLNPSFEGKVAGDATPEGWMYDVSKTINVYVDKSKFKTGTASLTFQNIGGNSGQASFNTVYQRDPIRVSSGRTLECSVFILAENSVGFNSLRARFYNSDKPSLYVDYYTNPISRTHTGFVESSVTVTVPPWADTLSLACVAAGERGNVWFDDILVTESLSDPQPFFELATVTNPFKYGMDKFGNFWITNRKDELIAVGTGLVLHSTVRNIDSLQALHSSDPSPEFLRSTNSGKVGGTFHDLAQDGQATFTFAMNINDKAGTISWNANSRRQGVTPYSIVISLDGNYFSGVIRAASGDQIIKIEKNSAPIHDVLEMIFGQDKELLSLSFTKPVIATSSFNVKKCVVISVSGNSGENGEITASLVARNESPALAARLDNLLREARTILKSGSLIQAEKMYQSLKKDYPTIDYAVKEADKSLEEIAKELGKLNTDLGEIMSHMQNAAKAEKVEDFESAYEELKALLEKIRVRAPESELHDKAERAIADSSSLTSQMEQKITERKARKLLEMAKDAQREEKFVLSRTIIENLLQTYPDTDAAREAELLLVDVRRSVDAVKQAAQEWEEVFKRAENLVKNGKKDGAKDAVKAFLEKYPFFIPAKSYLKTL